MDIERSQERALLRFHLQVGTRLALRVFSPLPALALAVYFLLGPQFVLFFAGILFRPEAVLLTVPLLTGIMVIFALTASRRICLGLTGWLRHLPCRESRHRCFAVLAIAVSQIPILLVLGLFILGASLTAESGQFSRLTGLPVLGLGAAAAVLPVKKRGVSAALGTAACLIALSGWWVGHLPALGLIYLALVWGGPLTRPREKAIKPDKGRPWMLPIKVRLRALKLRFLIPYLGACLPFGLAYGFITNNRLNPSLSYRMILFSGGLSLAVFFALSAGFLTVRLPAWPWSRTLPLSARRRIFDDALFLGSGSLPVLMPAGLFHLPSVLPLFLGIFPLALLAAGTLRAGEERKLGPLGPVLSWGLLGALILCIWPWSGWLFPAAAWPAYIYADRLERQRKISRWDELHHLADGDSLSWSRS